MFVLFLRLSFILADAATEFFGADGIYSYFMYILTLSRCSNRIFWRRWDLFLFHVHIDFDFVYCGLVTRDFCSVE